MRTTLAFALCILKLSLTLGAKQDARLPFESELQYQERLATESARRAALFSASASHAPAHFSAEQAARLRRMKVKIANGFEDDGQKHREKAAEERAKHSSSHNGRR